MRRYIASLCLSLFIGVLTPSDTFAYEPSVAIHHPETPQEPQLADEASGEDCEEGDYEGWSYCRFDPQRGVTWGCDDDGIWNNDCYNGDDCDECCGWDPDCASRPYGFDTVWYGFNPCYTANGCGDPDWLFNGMFIPDYPPLFPEFMANPREVCLSVGWRFNDQVFSKNMIDVSYGQPFPIWRWFNVFCDGDAMEIDLQGALWAIFDPLHESAPLVNADYYFGFPLTWACGPWSWRLRGYHISSHIGDEFLLVYPGFNRKNPSAQYLDFFVAYQLSREIRIYSGYGRIFMVDSSFPIKRNYFEWGLETYFPYLRYDGAEYCVLGQPFYAMHFRYLQDDGYRQDATYVLGYELRKLSGMQGRLRAFMEYHKGTSLEGQFARDRTDYFSIRLTYGY